MFVIRLCALVLLTAAFVACGGGSENVARVGGEEITEEDVERMVEFYEEELTREGHEVPVEGSESRRFLERRLLGIIVYREQLEQAAAEEFGIRNSEEEVEERLERSEEAREEKEREGEGGEEGEEGIAFIENAIRIQLIKEKVAERIGADKLDDWIAKALGSVPVEYEEGWEPVEAGQTPPPTVSIP
jgi:hypothetical protein